MSLGIQLAEAGLLPDAVLRLGIRRELAARLRSIRTPDRELVAALRQAPVAIETDAANEQHYELPPEFFEQVLGPRLKYSCGFWGDETDDLATAERRMLSLTCERAGVRDGMTVLDLGCGWGSLSLWIAERFPRCRVVGVSNSLAQRAEILRRAERRGLRNVEVRTADVNALDFDECFDRVVSVEMFEHVRNHAELLRRISGWLLPGGQLFVHVFCHRTATYAFETDDWMGRHFFTGGLMPSEDLLREFSSDLRVDMQWRVDGRHYQQTSEAWLERLDLNRDHVMPALAKAYGELEAERWLQRWRLFFLSCSELFGYRDGTEWFVSHYRMSRSGS